MRELVTIFGYGPVGSAVSARLLRRGQPVRIAQRSRPTGLPAGAAYCQANVLDPASVRETVRGSGQIVLAIGFQYSGKIWSRCWPLAMSNILEAAAKECARVVFVDDLYMYGPQDAPLTEAMPLTGYGTKPAVRAGITRQWQASSAEGRVLFTALRAPDFYGPHVGNSHLGRYSLAAIAKGKAPTMFVNPNFPHDFAYVPDFARGVVELLDAPNEDFGQAWHLPCAPTRSAKQILQAASRVRGLDLPVRTCPHWLRKAMGVIMPVVGEMEEMDFQWDRPYRVDATRFAERFDFVPTALETGIKETLESFSSVRAQEIAKLPAMRG